MADHFVANDGPPRVLITGATGLLGRAVVQVFQHMGWDTFATGLSRANPPRILKVNLLNKEEVENALDMVKPHVVVHCAANRSPDSCSIDPDGARLLNTHASSVCASLTAARSILLIYISTDYVFPGTRGEAPYNPNSPTHPPNLYGLTKRDGELAILEATKDSYLGVVLRVPLLYGDVQHNSESAVSALVDAIYQAQTPNAKTITVDNWAQRYPTNTEDVGRVVQQITKLYLEAYVNGELRWMPRILHFSAEEKMTKYEMCQVLADVLGLPLGSIVPENNPGVTEDNVVRPYDCHLNSDLVKKLGINTTCMEFKAWWRRWFKAYRK